MNETPIDLLLVDDEPRNLDALEAILADPGYRLVRAVGGDDALKALLANDVAAIVLDVQMPDVNGFELAKIIKATKKYREIPILFLTAHLLEDQDIIAGYGAGAVDYLTKPANPQVLRHKIAVFAELFRKTRALAELNATLESRVRERTAELERSEAALRAADRQKDVFLATLAHELRNPLAPLRIGLDLLQRERLPDSTGRTLQVMNRQVAHMVRLIDDLLDVGRVSSGKLELQRRQVDLAETLRGVIEEWQPVFKERRQEIHARIEQPILASADPVRVAQIVGNLLNNASKFSAEGTGVVVDLARDGTHAIIRVSDAGIGIAADHLARVFEMFSRVEHPSVEAKGGLGIGLALSRRLAEMHGGEMRVSSPGPGRGSVFTLVLPALDVAAVRSSVPPPAPLAVKPREVVKVVVVEDNADGAELLAAWLEAREYGVTVAYTGPEGLERIQSEKPSIVLCDIGLPEMDGNEVCRRVRELDLGYRPHMIALTGWGMKEDKQRTTEAGFDHHLVKPVDAETLFTLLEEVRASLTVSA